MRNSTGECHCRLRGGDSDLDLDLALDLDLDLDRERDRALTRKARRGRSMFGERELPRWYRKPDKGGERERRR